MLLCLHVLSRRLDASAVIAALLPGAASHKDVSMRVSGGCPFDRGLSLHTAARGVQDTA